jgi:hypothetical protein
MAEIVINLDEVIDFEDNTFSAPEQSTASVLLDSIQTSARNFRANQDLAANVAYLQAGVNGTNPIDEYQNTLGQLEGGADLNAVYDEAKLNYTAQVEQDALNLINEQIRRSVEAGVPVESLPDFTQIQNEVNASVGLYLDSDGIERMKADLYATGSTDELMVRKEMARQEAVRTVIEDMGERSFYDVATDFGENILPLAFTKDINEVVGKTFGGMSEFVEAAYAFQRLDPEEQRVVYQEQWHPRIMEAAADNQMSALAFTELLFDPDALSEVVLSGFLDATFVFEAAQGARALFNMGKAAAATRNIGKQYKQMGNDEVAATTTAVAGKVDDATPTGISKQDAAGSADVHVSPETSVGAMDDISDAVQRARKTTTQQMIDSVAQDAAEGLSRGERRNLTKGIRSLQFKLESAQRALQVAKTSMKSVRHNAAARGAVQEMIASTKDRIKALETQIDIRQLKLELNVPKQAARANLSRLEQGIIPDEMRGQFDAIVAEKVTKELAIRAGASDEIGSKLREAAKARSGGSELLTNDTLQKATHNNKLIDNPELYGVSEEYANQLKAAVVAPMRQLADELDAMAPHALSDEQMGKIEASVVEDLQKAARVAGQEISIGIPAKTDKGFRVKYALDGVDKELDYTWTVNDIGVFESTATASNSIIASVKRNVASPRIMLQNYKQTMVDDIKVAQDQVARSINALGQQFKDIEKGLSKQQSLEVDSLLMAGDEEHRVFTFRELLDGTVELASVGKKKFDRDVIDAYFAKRAFYDEMHSMRDYYMRRQMQFEGMEELSYKNSKGVVQKLVASKATPEQVARSTDEFIFDVTADANKRAKYINKNTASAFVENNGFEYVRLLEPRVIKGKKVRYGIMNTADAASQSKLAGLPPRVLNYTKGYVPRIYRKGYWFVKSDVDNTTLYAAETKELAQQWAAKATDEGEDGIQYAVKRDSELDTSESLVENANGFGGLYTGTRSKKPLLVRDGEDAFRKAERVSVNDATESYIQSISNTIPLNEYRSGLAKEWENTVSTMLKADGKEDAARKVNFRDRQSATGLSGQQNADMEAVRTYIADMAGVPTNEELATSSWMAELADKMYGKSIIGGKPREWVLNNINGDPITALKGTTFNLHLGWFNIRQLFVQAQNAAIAVSVSPQHAPAAMLDSMAMRAAIFSDSPAVWRKYADLNPGMDSDDFVDSIQKFKQSGLIDGIIRQGDWNNHATGVAHQSFKTFRKAAQAGQVFFKEGELASRIMAWNIARRRLGKDATARQLSDETTRLTMDLSTANSARWQQGVLGIPTQFLQVQAKFIENILPTAIGGSAKWTGKEKAAAFTGQLALYGTIGIPIAEDLSSYVADMMGVTPQEFAENNPTLLEGIEEGVLGVFTAALGFENNFSTSASLVQGVFSENPVSKAVRGLMEGIIDGDTRVGIDDVLGASVNSLRRGGDVVTNFAHNVDVLLTTPSWENSGYLVMGFTGDIAAMTSTWSNARKVRALHAIGLQSKQGATLIAPERFEQMNDSTLWMRALGFNFDIEDAYYNQKSFNIDREREIRFAKTELQKAYNRYLQHGNIDRLKSEEMTILAPFSEVDQRTVKKRVLDSVFSPKTDLDKQSQKFYQGYMRDGSDVYPAFRHTIDGDN